MIAARRVLVLGALVFAGIGAACLLLPESLFRAVDLALDSPTARVEIYAFYGGFELGIAVFLGICAARTDWLPLGLTAMATMLGGMGGVRLVATLLVTGASAIHFAFASFELAGAAASVWALRRVRDVRSPLWF